MATHSMTEQAPNSAAPREGAMAWIILAVGIVVSIAWVIFGQQLGETITIETIGTAVTVYYALLFVPLIIIALLLGYLGHIRVLRVGEAPGKWGLVGFAIGLGGLFATVGYAWLNGGLVDGAEPPTGMRFALLALALTVLQVGAEEVLFRGWLQPALIARIGVIGGIAAGAVVFACFHLSAGVSSPISLFNLLLGGLLFGLLAWRSGGLVAPFLAHYAWNAIEDVGLGLVPNPGTGPLGSLTDLDLAGVALWGAHAEGLNASIGTTLVLLALILPLAFRQPKDAVAT